MIDRSQDSAVELAQLLRSCVQCGLCLPHCATWLATGNEVQSPRGRLVLLADTLSRKADGDSLPAAYVAAFDQCIGCRACETACPSGVPFTVLEYGQKLAVIQGSGTAAVEALPAVPDFLLHRLDLPRVLGFLGRSAGLLRRFLAAVLGDRWRGRLSRKPAALGNLVRLLGSMPHAPESDDQLCRLLDPLVQRGLIRTGGTLPEIAAAETTAGPLGVAFFQGCANRALLPATSRRLVEVLRAAGCVVDIPSDQDCCGALAAHTGRPGRAATLHRRNREAFAPCGQPGTVIVAEAAGCGLELKEQMGALADQVTDAVDLLAGLPLPALGPIPVRVVIHDPCHALHGQGIYNQPRELLAKVPGLVLVEAAEEEVCCGSGGAWGLRHRDLSEQLGRRKAENLAATGADLAVTSNPGCLGQIADGLATVAPEMPILPLTDLLWYACKRGQSAHP
jgi:glycolate dehydrogenase iron-sulfur subunit